MEIEEETEFKSKLKVLNKRNTQYLYKSFSHYNYSEKFQKLLKVNKVGTFGVFKKLDSTCNTNKGRKESIKKHLRKKSKRRMMNLREICMHTRIATYAVYCLEYSLSSADFVHLNDKAHLISTESTATENNYGAEQFFTSEIMFTKTHQKCFKSVNSVLFSPDKATVNKVPYTVLTIYFFYRREIHVMINSLHVIKSDEYDGSSSAKMVCFDLMASLGLKRSEIKNIFHHAVYYGVYATPGE